MVASVQLVRWGNSLVIRIPKPVTDAAKLTEGDTVTLEVGSEGSVTVKSVEPPTTVEELIAGITPENLHNEQPWGEPVGAELW